MCAGRKEEGGALAGAGHPGAIFSLCQPASGVAITEA